ncbi:hypothetical protein B9Z55_002700 [Caenorhabditis nigoni]|uniref:Sdz-33 F-box domain-containing protein n=1 Tax=Caenorhabditis nigoni TaxID=1611254 RepID=A0A2G5VM83_9PELO|nr:hypothetical protein B9Z55_002700 [Caenorhabditis nigoni]
MPFPILRTSFVVLSEVISLLEPNEMVTASLCSKNVRRLLKNHHQRRKPSKWRLSMVDQPNRGSVTIINGRNDNRTTVMMAKLHSELAGATHKSVEISGYKRTFEKGFPVLYFQDRVIGTKIIVDYVTDLFGLDIYGLVIDRNDYWTLDWINNRQERSLGHNYALNKDKTEDNVLVVRTAILSDSSDCVSTNANVSDNVRNLRPPDVLVFDSNAHRATCDDLMKFDSMKLFIYFTRLSVSDMNTFLRHWRAGGSPRLAYLRVVFDENCPFFYENFDQDLELVETDEVRSFREIAEDEVEEIQGDYSIQRGDGVKATISCGRRQFVMVVWHADGN